MIKRYFLEEEVKKLDKEVGKVRVAVRRAV
jgi:hypothetical protein